MRLFCHVTSGVLLLLSLPGAGAPKLYNKSVNDATSLVGLASFSASKVSCSCQRSGSHMPAILRLRIRGHRTKAEASPRHPCTMTILAPSLNSSNRTGRPPFLPTGLPLNRHGTAGRFKGSALRISFEDFVHSIQDDHRVLTYAPSISERTSRKTPSSPCPAWPRSSEIAHTASTLLCHSEGPSHVAERARILTLPLGIRPPRAAHCYRNSMVMRSVFCMYADTRSH